MLSSRVDCQFQVGLGEPSPGGGPPVERRVRIRRTLCFAALLSNLEIEQHNVTRRFPFRFDLSWAADAGSNRDIFCFFFFLS